MKGIALIASLAQAAGGGGRPYAEALLCLLEEEGDQSAAYFRKVVAGLPPHKGDGSGIEPSAAR